MTVYEFQVAGMSCGHCEAAVRRSLSEIPGIASVEVSAASGQLTLTATTPLADEVVIAAVDEAGYEAVRV
jgi:copper chaperone CopZ